MQTEIEAKWLDISIPEMRKQLKAIGAKLVVPERMMVRANFDYPDRSLEKIGGWIRVRNEGDKITLSYKQLNDRTLHGTKEVTVVVNDFDDTCNFLTSIGIKQTSFQESKRESWKLGATEIELDTWPWIPSDLEIEAHDEPTLRAVAEQLNLDYSKALHGSVEIAYQAAFDVTEEEVNSWPEIRFGDVPEELERKRKQKT